jgi:hypothetical protein
MILNASTSLIEGSGPIVGNRTRIRQVYQLFYLDSGRGISDYMESSTGGVRLTLEMNTLIFFFFLDPHL